MTTPATVVRPVAPPTVLEPVDVCDVCLHAISGHDPIATRYCHATQTNALSRGCICRLVPSGS
jgi:hypothetical protein